MSTLEQQPHPSHLTEEQKAALRASDPAAFDDDDDAGGGELEGGAPITAPTEAPTAAATPADAPAATTPPSGDEPPADGTRADGTVDRRQFDGVLGELRETRAEAKALRERMAAIEQAEAERQAALAAAQTRDYAQELADLEQKWDDGELDIDFKTFQRQREEIVVAKTRDEVLAAERSRLEKEEADRQELLWTTSRDKFLTDHPEYGQDTYRMGTLNLALQQAAHDNPGADYATLFDKAHKEVVTRMPLPGGTVTPPPSGTGTPNATPRAQADARASATASAAPPPLHGGVGNRGTDSSLDLSTLKPGEFSKLSKAEQERLLGEGAV